MIVQRGRIHEFERLHRGVTVVLWIVVTYLIVMYAALRWGSPHPSRLRYPGSD